MNIKIYILLILLLINICLTIYLIYKCFNNKIIEGNPVSDAWNKTKKGVEKTTNTVVSGGKEAVSKTGDYVGDKIVFYTDKGIEYISQADLSIILGFFEPLEGVIRRWFFTVKDSTKLLENHGGGGVEELGDITNRISGIGRRIRREIDEAEAEAEENLTRGQRAIRKVF